MIRVQYNESDLKNFITQSDSVGRNKVVTLELLYVLPSFLSEEKQYKPIGMKIFDIKAGNLHYEINEFSANCFIGYFDRSLEYAVVAEFEDNKLKVLLERKKFAPIAIVADESFRWHPEDAEIVKPLVRNYADNKKLPIFIHAGDSEFLDHQAVIDMIRDWGADTAFTYPGRFDGILSVVDGMQGYMGRAARDLLGTYPHVAERIAKRRPNDLFY